MNDIVKQINEISSNISHPGRKKGYRHLPETLPKLITSDVLKEVQKQTEGKHENQS